MLSACQNTDKLYLFSFANDLGDKDKLEICLSGTCNANALLF